MKPTLQFKRQLSILIPTLTVAVLTGCGVEEQENPVSPPDMPEETPTELIPVDENFPDPTVRAAENRTDNQTPGLRPRLDAEVEIGEAASQDPVPGAQAVLNPTAGNTATGVVDFFVTEDAQGNSVLHIEATLSEVSAGAHGFHVHETGDCSAADASSAGGHFNPDGEPHGALDEMQSHAGDLGNITADEHGVATIDITTDKLHLDGEHSLLGKAVVLHSGEDDLESQPSGDAGERIACGVVMKFEEVDQQV